MVRFETLAMDANSPMRYKAPLESPQSLKKHTYITTIIKHKYHTVKRIG